MFAPLAALRITCSELIVLFENPGVDTLEQLPLGGFHSPPCLRPLNQEVVYYRSETVVPGRVSLASELP